MTTVIVYVFSNIDWFQQSGGIASLLKKKKKKSFILAKQSSLIIKRNKCALIASLYVLWMRFVKMSLLHVELT